MRSRPLGRTDVRVTELGFGGAAIGGLYTAVSEETARDAVAAAWDAGVRYFDTAPHYGLGLSERRLGAALRDRPRDEYVVSTKVGRLLEPNPSPSGSDLADGFDVPDDLSRAHDYSRAGVRRSLEMSLERLGLERVDVVLVHDPDDHLDQALDEAVPALVELREEKVVGAIGVGMNQWQALRRFVVETDVDVVMVAGRWTLLDRGAQPLLTACAARSVSVLAAGPFNSGILASPRPEEGATYEYATAPVRTLAAARRLAEISQRHGTTLPAAALQFPLRHPSVASVVVGMRTGDEARQDASLFAAAVPAAAWSELDQA